MVTSLVEPGEGTAPHSTVVAVAADGGVVRHRATHLGPHAAWATPGPGPARPVRRPWGRLGLLAGEELEPFEPSRALALQEADVLAVPAAVRWPWPIHFPGSDVPPGPRAAGAGPPLRPSGAAAAGDSHEWIAMAVTDRPGWTALESATRGPELGRICEDTPQLVRRRADLLAAPLLAAPR